MPDGLSIRCVTVGRWRVNCYLVHDHDTGIIIDPGDEPDRLFTEIATEGFRPVAILNTHAHFDHVGAVARMRAEFGIPFYLHSGDKRLLSQANLYRSLAGDKTVHPTPPIDACLDTAPPPGFGQWQVEVLATPGHTAGSVCFRIADAIWSGDTLFCGKTGRTNLPGSSAETLRASLEALRRQPVTLELFPGHGPACRLGVALDGVLERPE